MVLPRWISWIIIITLVSIDISIALMPQTISLERSPLLGLVYQFGSIGMWVLVLAVPFIFLLGSKALGWLLKVTENYPLGEELVLTVLVIVYGTYVLYMLIIFPSHGYYNGLNPLTILPLLLLSTFPYGIWINRKMNVGAKKTFHLTKIDQHFAPFIIGVPIILLLISWISLSFIFKTPEFLLLKSNQTTPATLIDQTIIDEKMDNLLEALNTNDYKTFSRDFSLLLKDSFTQEKFESTRKLIISNYGKYLRQDTSDAKPLNSLFMQVYQVQFEKGKLEVKAIFDQKSEQIEGLWFSRPI